MSIIRQGSNPVAHVADYSFLGDLGGIAANLAYKYPELKAADQAAKDDSLNKQEAQQMMMGVMEAIKQTPENRKAYASKFGLDDAQIDEHLYNTFQQINPKESESSSDYMGRIFNFTKDNIGDLDGAKDGLFQQYIATVSSTPGADMNQVKEMQARQTNKKTFEGLDAGIADGSIRGKDATMQYLRKGLGGDPRKTHEASTLYQDQFGTWDKEDTELKNTEQSNIVDANADAGATQFYTLDPLQWATTGKQEYRKQLMSGVDVNNKMAVAKVQQKIDDIDDVMNFKQRADEMKEKARRAAQAGGVQQATKVLAIIDRKVKDLEATNNKIKTNLKDKEKAGTSTPEEVAAAGIAIKRNEVAKTHFSQTGKEINDNIATGNYSAKSSFAEERVGEDVAAVNKSAVIDILTGGVEGSKVQILDAGGIFSLGSNKAIADKATDNLGSVVGQGAEVVYDEKTGDFNVTVGEESVGTFKRGDIKSDGTLKKFDISGSDGAQASLISEVGGQSNYDQIANFLRQNNKAVNATTIRQAYKQIAGQ
jgi:hypothetical protein